MKKKNSFVYPILFMMVLTFVFISLLAFLDDTTKPIVEKQEALQVQKNILYVLGFSEVGEGDAMGAFYDAHVEEKKQGDRVYYEGQKEGEIIGYAFKIEGKGLWGEIEGYLAMDTSLETLKGVTFTKHSETPGLGGRIEEDWYKEQFRDLSVGEGLVYRPKPGGNLDAISGATQTSEMTLQLIRENIAEIQKEMEGMAK